MKVSELYAFLNQRIPKSLSCEWDNDGLMCSPDVNAEVNKTLVTLDVTEEIVDFAIERGFDLIVSHHPLLFKPVSSINDSDHISRKIIKLIANGVSVFSFHTRLDKVAGGVNDKLAELIGVENTEPFGSDSLGRIGDVEEMTMEDFAYKVKVSLGSDVVKYSDGYNTVRRVALVGGDGKDYVKEALKAGADTYLSGRISYNLMEEASELGINLVEAGHYFTEQPICEVFVDMLLEISPPMYVEVAKSNMIKYL